MKLKLSACYDKLALTLAVLAAVGLGSAIYVDAGKVERDFAQPLGDPPGDSGDPAVPNRPASDSQALLDGPPIFTSPPLHLSATGVLVDLRDPKSPPVHPPIPNRWWLQHGLDPAPADAPERDPDRDGFSNLEEFQGQTDPGVAHSRPPLVHKLRVAGLQESTLLVSYVSDDCVGDPGPESTFGFRQEWIEQGGRAQAVRKRTSQSGLQAGRGVASMFFREGPGQLRFELDSVRRDPAFGLVSTLIDQRANKAGRMYEVRKGSRHGIIIRDYTAVLYLELPGEETKRFRVEENTAFSLPFDRAAAEKRFRFVEIREREAGPEVAIEFEREGETLRLHLPVPQD